jgi:MFS family permease
VFLLFINIFWTLGAIFEAGLAWIFLSHDTMAGISSWRWLLLVTAIPTAILILLVPLTPESPRFLYVSKRYEETEAILKKVMRWNGKPELPGHLVHDEVEQVPQRANFFVLFEKSFLRTTLPLFAVWFLMAFSYYGVVVMTPEYFKAHSSTQDAPFLAVFITSAAELPGIFLAAGLINTIGRKKTQILLFVVCGITMFLLMIPTYMWLLTIFAVICRMCIMGAFGATYVFTPGMLFGMRYSHISEVFPTIIRSTGLGTCASISRLGGVVTPFVATALFKVNAWVPLIIYGVGCIIGGIMTALVPVETTGKHLADHVERSPVTDSFVALQDDTTVDTALETPTEE